MRCYAAVAAALLLIAGAAYAAAPSVMSYQGKLTDLSGNPLQGTFSVQFTIYTHQVGGTVRWTETQSVTTESDGSFAVMLGSVVPIADSVFEGCQPSLAIKVGSDEEMSPRTRLGAVPFCYRISTVDEAAGGTLYSKLTIGSQNTNTGDYAFVAGIYNEVSGMYATIPGGYNNWATGENSAVGGGTMDSAGGPNSVVAGGYRNKAKMWCTTVGGGYGNIAGGVGSTASGGTANNAAGENATVGGGYVNIAGGYASTIPGGEDDSATGRYSFAAGRNASARHDGAFVWADSSITLFPSSAANQFSVRASGGTRIYSNSSLTAGVTLPAGSSAWIGVSDSAAKRNIRPVDPEELLDKLDQLPVSRWSYKAQDPGIEHIGPMAQDFYALFRVGDNDTTISTIDPSGVALAAVKELHRQQHELSAKVKELDELKAEVRELRALVHRLASEKVNEAGGK